MNLLDPEQLQAAIDQLSEEEESRNFVIHFNWRNPPPGRPGKGSARDGVRGYNVIARYIRAFERLYDTVTAKPFEWSVRTGPTKQTHVYVLPVDYPFTESHNGVPVIILPSRSQEPWLQAALHRADIEAVHEATHAFTMSIRPYGPGDFYRWKWFHEATAVYMEDLVYGGNLDSLRFAMDWADEPERSLDREDNMYQSGFFARYLARKFDRDLMLDIWKAGPGVEPLEVVECRNQGRLVRGPLRMAPVFGDYAHDSYFLWDSNSYGFEGDVFLRFGQRALTEAFVVTPTNAATSSGAVDHLACRYYRIGIASGKGVEATVEVDNGDRDADGFRCFLSVSGRDHHRGSFVELMPAVGVLASRRLSGHIPAADLAAADSVVLTVANCGTRADPAENDQSEDLEHDDGREYRIAVRWV